MNIIQTQSYIYPPVQQKQQIKKKKAVKKKKKQIKQTQFGVAKKNVFSLAGDRFSIEEGQKLLVKRKPNGFLEVYLEGKVGIFESDSLLLEDEM